LDSKALYNLSYGLYVITSKKESRLNGQVANTVFQISSEPVTIAISLNKNNLTNEYVRESKLFVVSVLSQDAPLSLIGQLGFKSGRDTDKFNGVNYLLSQNGIPYLADNTLAYIGARVISEIDALTHTVFIGEVTEAEILKEGTPMTYAYYQQVKKGSVSKNAPTYIKNQVQETASGKAGKFVCSVCGYIYDPETGDPDNGVPAGTPFEKLPPDWVCPVCGAAKSEFKEEPRG